MAVETVTTVIRACECAEGAHPRDLIDLAMVHDELSIPITDSSNDTFLCRAIRQASESISSYCNRVFNLEVLQDAMFIQQDPYPWQVPGGVYPLQLSRWPLVHSGVVTITGNTHGSIVLDGIASTTGIREGTLAFASDGSIPAGTRVKTVGPRSLFLTQAATTSVTGLSCNTGVQVVQALSATQTQTLVYGQDFKVDAEHGWLIRLNSFTGVSERWESIPVTVQYQAGFREIPADIQDACLRLVTARFRARGRDPMLVQRAQPNAIGGERYWVGAAPGQTGAFAPEILGLIDHYRVPVTA